MGTRSRFLACVLLSGLLLGASVLAQSSAKYGVGHTPSADELHSLDISVGPDGAELPPGRGTAKEGAELFMSKGCVVCHGANGTGGRAPELKSKDGPNVATWERGRILPVRAPFATTVWDYINRAMPLGREGSLKPDEVYALTAFLLNLNEVIPEDLVLDQQSLPKVKMPIGEDYAALPDWKPKTRRMKGYPY
jgi:cytochrome c